MPSKQFEFDGLQYNFEFYVTLNQEQFQGHVQSAVIFAVAYDAK